MDIVKLLVVNCAVIFLGSCASTAKFPVSDVAPAAVITAKKWQDNNKNFVIEVIARHLAEAERLNPPKKNYSVWIVAENGTIKNIGQLMQENEKKTILKTTTPFKVKEIFITAEDQGNLNYPSGVEISRTTFSK